MFTLALIDILWLIYLSSAAKIIVPADAHAQRAEMEPNHASTCSFISGRELAFTFAICYRRSVCLSSVCDVGAPCLFFGILK